MNSVPYIHHMATIHELSFQAVQLIYIGFQTGTKYRDLWKPRS